MARNSFSIISDRRRRIVAVAGAVALAGALGACGSAGADDTASTGTDASTTDVVVPTSSDSGGPTSSPPTTVGGGSTTVATSTVPTTVADAPTSAPTESTTTASPTTAAEAPLSFPEALRGVWRVSDGDSVTAEECNQDEVAVENLDKVLAVRADSYSFFEDGGRMLEVHEREPMRIDATFDTTVPAADTPTQDRLLFEVQDDGDVLILRQSDSATQATRYVRCPAVPDEPSAPEALELDEVDFDTVIDAGFEAIGCWLRVDEAFDAPSVFFVSGDVAIMVIDGETVILPNRTSDDDGPIPSPEVDDTYSGNGYAATFVRVGPERETSIESSDRDARLIVSTPDDRLTAVDGVLGCGV